MRDNIGYTLDAEARDARRRVLRARGYATGAAVSAYVLRRATGIDAGFDFYDDGRDRQRAPRPSARCSAPGRETVARALDWLRGAAGRPFFLFVHLYEPHTPWTPPEAERARYGATYDGEIAAADAAVGALLDGLRELGRYDDALVVLVSDHGEGLGDHGEQEHGDPALPRGAARAAAREAAPRRAGRDEARTRRPACATSFPTLAAALGVAARRQRRAAATCSRPADAPTRRPSTARRSIRGSTWAGASCARSSTRATT